MIPVHRITQPDHELYVNPELIQTVEANPDTVIALTNGSKFVVSRDARRGRAARPRVARRHRSSRSGGHTSIATNVLPLRPRA